MERAGECSITRLDSGIIDYDEICIEKAWRSIKGSYQCLLSQGRIINNINTEFIDRQDGASSEGIIKSKLSYKPIKKSRRSIYLI